jgi:hypothetical protein
LTIASTTVIRPRRAKSSMRPMGLGIVNLPCARRPE